MTHQLLLHSYARAYRIKPRSVSVPHAVRAQSADASSRSSLLEHMQDACVGIRQSAQFHR